MPQEWSTCRDARVMDIRHVHAYSVIVVHQQPSASTKYIPTIPHTWEHMPATYAGNTCQQHITHGNTCQQHITHGNTCQQHIHSRTWEHMPATYPHSRRSPYSICRVSRDIPCIALRSCRLHPKCIHVTQECEHGSSPVSSWLC